MPSETYSPSLVLRPLSPRLRSFRARALENPGRLPPSAGVYFTTGIIVECAMLSSGQFPSLNYRSVCGKRRTATLKLAYLFDAVRWAYYQ